MNRNGIIAIIDDKGREKERYPVVYGAKMLFEDGAKVKTNADPARMGSVHVLDPDRSQRQGSLQGPDRRHHPAGAGGRNHRHVAVGGDGFARRKAHPDAHRSARGRPRSEEKRYLMPTHAHLMVSRWRRSPRRRRAGQDSARHHQDQGHHRRSAARGRTVRSPQAARNRRHRRNQRHREVRRSRQGHAQDLHHRRRRRAEANTPSRAASTSTCRKASA